MWPSRAHILKPLTDQSSLKKRAPIKWKDEMQQGFDKMRLIMAANARAAYSDYNKRFDVCTDASDFQLGACIIQEGRLVAYFSWKLTEISVELYNNGKGNAFHRCNSQKISKYAYWWKHPCFYGP
jgi:hypothetical protein